MYQFYINLNINYIQVSYQSEISNAKTRLECPKEKHATEVLENEKNQVKEPTTSSFMKIGSSLKTTNIVT